MNRPLPALETTTDRYRLASLRYDLSKLRAKGLVERVYALTAGLLSPVTADARLAEEKPYWLDRLYQRIVTDLDALLQAVGLRAAA